MTQTPVFFGAEGAGAGRAGREEEAEAPLEVKSISSPFFRFLLRRSSRATTALAGVYKLLATVTLFRRMGLHSRPRLLPSKLLVEPSTDLHRPERKRLSPKTEPRLICAPRGSKPLPSLTIQTLGPSHRPHIGSSQLSCRYGHEDLHQTCQEGDGLA